MNYKEKIENLFIENCAKLFLESESIDKRYQNPDGTFKKQVPGDEPGAKESKFGGCVNYMHAQGKSWDSARKICAYIARMKGK